MIYYQQFLNRVLLVLLEPGQGPVRYWLLGEANVCVTKRGDQADASSAYSVRKVDVDAHGSPVGTLVRKTSWYDAIQVIKAADGKLAVTIGYYLSGHSSINSIFKYYTRT